MGFNGKIVRYLLPNGGWGNVAELEFYGCRFSSLSTNSPLLGASLVGTNLTLTWPLTNAGFTLQSCTNLASDGG